LIDISLYLVYAGARPGRPGAAEPAEPRQDRKIATVRKRFWAPPVSCPDISGKRILMPRWVPFVIAIILGIALGLLYGWVIEPVHFIDTTPDSLRADYRADYILMVAESYHADQNAGLAARRLSIFGSQSPANLASQALQTGRQSGYSPNDLSLLQELLRAMQAYQPAPAVGTP